MRPLRNLLVWQRSYELTKSVYATTQDLPESERFGLTSQARRSAVSIPSNIAEGAGRSTDREFARFIDIAASSASELEYQLFLASELGLLRESSEDLQQECREIRAMLTALRRTLLRRPLADS